jgi:hypothetical protein
MNKNPRSNRYPPDIRRKKTVGNRHHRPHPEKDISAGDRKNHSGLIACIAIAVLVIIPFSLGKYFEFNSPDPFDSGSYVYSAKHILDGAKIGVEEKPACRLGTLTLNILGVELSGFNEIGSKIIQAILQLAALAMMFIVMRKLFGTLAAGVGVIIASAYLSAPFIAKFGNVKEQYMIAFMVMGISCFVFRQLGGRWWWAVLAGGLVSWAPLFKETGTTAIGAIGLFVIAQPIFKHRTWKQTGIDILLLLAGAVAAISPFYIWILGWHVQLDLPYIFIWQALFPSKAGFSALRGSYISGARQLRSFSEQLPIVMRYYVLLSLPIALALGSILARIVRLILSWTSKEKISVKPYDRFVLLFAIWWLLDMAFVWISPRSYEQYYLPLNASAAMLGGYVIAIYSDKFKNAVFKTKWIIIGAIALVLMIIISWQIFFGIKRSPYSGVVYTNPRTGVPERQNGYLQRFDEISLLRRQNLKYPWQEVGEYIREHSKPTDKIFVWGWYPGIYVAAQRLAPTPWPFTSEMHTKTPERFANDIKGLLADLEANKPLFIVDSRKRHFPGNRPPLELWPVTGNGLLPNNTKIIDQFDTEYAKMLREKFGDAEAGRFEAMKPFREFVMKNYVFVRAFGAHILFKLKDSTTKPESEQLPGN